jgi:hypothetical protein
VFFEPGETFSEDSLRLIVDFKRFSGEIWEAAHSSTVPYPPAPSITALPARSKFM